MSLPATLTQLGPIAVVLLAGFTAARRRVIRRLQHAGASDAASASPVPTGLLTGFWLRRLVAAGVVGSTGEGRYWIYEEPLRRYRAIRRRRAVMVLVVALLLFFAMKSTGGLSQWFR